MNDRIQTPLAYVGTVSATDALVLTQPLRRSVTNSFVLSVFSTG